MAKKIIEAAWDCRYCGEKGIGGLSKHCPNCGHPQDEDTVFYLPEKKKVLDENTAEEYGKGEDWVCRYCGSLNRYKAHYCVNCGAARDAESGTYFANLDEKGVEREAQGREVSDDAQEPAQDGRRLQSNLAAARAYEGRRPDDAAAQKRAAPPAKTVRPKKKKGLIAFLILAAVFAVLVAVFMPKKGNASLSEKSWVREVEVEAYRTVHEDDWSVPAGGRVTDTRLEVHHYDHVVDHYEDVEVQKSRSVIDGYDTETYYVNNGDGTYTEETRSVPRYTTEYYYVTESRPVYRDDPVFYTKYYYDIERWVYDRTETTEGGDETPYWPEIGLAANERTGTEKETYVLDFLNEKGKLYRAFVPYTIWEETKTGKSYTLTVSAGKVIEIDGKRIDG